MSNVADVQVLIAKIQRLAENGGTPEEAAVAASKVQQLLLKHGLSMAQIDLDAGAPTLSGYGHQKYACSGSWKQSLLNSVAKNNDCRVVGLDRGVVDIVGHTDNVDGVLSLFEWLCEELDRLVDLAWRLGGPHEDDYGRPYAPRPWKSSYREGAVQTINKRLTEERRLREQALKGTSSSTALIAIDQKVTDVTRELYPNIRTKYRRINRGAGYASGARDAAGMSLNRRHNVAAGGARRLT